MAFELQRVVPWGRNFDEYRRMFTLREEDLSKRIISFGDGPAGFNAQMTTLGYQVVSLDPIYQFSKASLGQRIRETKDEVLAQLRNNEANFVWTTIKDIPELEQIRMEAMQTFLADYEAGKEQGRYVPHALPDQTPFQDDEFGLGLSSHFLILYAKLGLEFHLQSIREMLRICQEVRIFPLLDLDAKESSVLPDIVDFFSKEYTVSIEQVSYEFQRNGNRMLRIAKSSFGMDRPVKNSIN